MTRTIPLGTFAGQDLTPAFARGSARDEGKARGGEEHRWLLALGSSGISWAARISWVECMFLYLFTCVGDVQE